MQDAHVVSPKTPFFLAALYVHAAAEFAPLHASYIVAYQRVRQFTRPVINITYLAFVGTILADL